MFSFHKPKVYRSPTGCCICKAKSSSSRFTDSAKYEEDFIECFLLKERRTGEICNACVLLVKRWKKLPPGSNRNWRHVVDARAGPGIKSLTKFKSKNKKKPKENVEKMEKIVKKKHVYLKPDRYREQSPAMSDDLTAEEYLAGTGSKGSSRAGSPAGSDDTAVSEKRLNAEASVNDWIDLTYFKRETICCGTIFKGPYGEVIVDPSLIKPCLGCIARQRAQRERRTNTLGSSPAHSSASASPAHSSASASPAHSVDSTSSSGSTSDASITAKPQTTKSFSDSSSDSGYDESSNQGIGESNKIAKTNQITAVSCNSGSNSSASSTIIQSPSSSSINSAKQPVLLHQKVTGSGLQQTASAQTIVKIHPVVSAVQLKSIAVTETVRIKAEVPIKLVPIKQVEKLMCKPLSLAVAPSGSVTLSSASSRPTRVVPPIASNPLVDFAIHASARQSVTN